MHAASRFHADLERDSNRTAVADATSTGRHVPATGRHAEMRAWAVRRRDLSVAESVGDVLSSLKRKAG